MPLTFDSLRRKAQNARTSQSTNYTLTKRDFAYLDGEQLSPEQKKILRQRGQPEVVSNYIAFNINGMIGVINSNNTDPRAYPRNPQDSDSADVVTKVLRYLADQAQLDEVKLQCAPDLLVGGVAATLLKVRPIVNLKRNTTDVQLIVERVKWNEFLYDPYSTETNFSDATYLGTAKWLDADYVATCYPEIGPEAQALVQNTSGGMGLDMDEENVEKTWIDSTRKRLLVVEMYYYEIGEMGLKKWRRAIFCAAGVIEDEEVPFVDDYGHSFCPLIAESCNVSSIDNSRFGLVRGMISDQDEINARLSRSLHLANTRVAYATSENTPPVDPEVVRREASRPDGVLPVGYQLMPNQDLSNGQIAHLQYTQGHMERSAPSAAVLGRTSDAQSGRAKLVDQQAGMQELGPTFHRLSNLEVRMYKMLWWAAQMYFTDEKIINVNGNENTIEHITINEPVVEMVPAPMMVPGPDGQPVPYVNAWGQPVMVEQAQVVDYKNRIADLDIDISVESTPNQVNLQHETFNSFMELARLGIDPGSPIMKMAIELMPIADKTRIKELVKEANEEAAAGQQEQAQVQEAVRQAALETHQADIGYKQAQTQEKQANAFAKMTESETKQIENQLFNLGSRPLY